MQYVGFDVSRDNADYALLTRSLTVKTQYKIPNQTEDIMAVLQPLSEKYHLTAGVESTAMYHLPVVDACAALNIPCKLLNPILTKEFLRSSIRKRKTDRDDAVVVAKLVAQGEGTLVHPEELRSQLKVLVRSSYKMATLAKTMHLHVRHVERVVGSAPPCLTEEEERLRQIQRELQKEAIAEAPIGPRVLLESITGIGPWIATVILAEVGNLAKYTSGDALVAAAGLDPRVRQSGALLHTTGKLTKRGSPFLRTALFQSAMTARCFDQDLKTYYERKRREGKGYTVAICAVARKMAHRIYAVAKRGTPYVQKKSTDKT